MSELSYIHDLYLIQNLDENQFVSKLERFILLSDSKSEHNIERKYVDIKKRKTLVKPPKTLCIHLNRLVFDNFGNMRLNRNHVYFDNILDLSTTDKKISSFDIDMKYKLCSVIQHNGTHENGHYFAYKNAP